MSVNAAPTVSIIVPNYNHARFLRQRLDTIFAQTYQDFEVILLDDCSTDESRDILREYASRPGVSHLVFNETNSGSTFKQWNKGVRLARGKYVWIAESDDYSDPLFLERLTPILESDPRVTLAYCRSWRVGEGGVDGLVQPGLPSLQSARWSGDFRVDGRRECRNFMTYGNIVENASAVVFRRATYEQAGGADESLRICGDWKMWCSLFLQGDVAYVAEPLNYYRFHGDSVRVRQRLWRSGMSEWLSVVGWTLERVRRPGDDFERVYYHHARLWAPAVLSGETSWPVKADILRRAWRIDPCSAAVAIPYLYGTKAAAALLRGWYFMLNLSLNTRRSLGLTRDGLAHFKAKLGR